MDHRGVSITIICAMISDYSISAIVDMNFMSSSCLSFYLRMPALATFVLSRTYLDVSEAYFCTRIHYAPSMMQMTLVSVTFSGCTVADEASTVGFVMEKPEGDALYN